MTSKQCTVVLNEFPVAKYTQYRAEGTRDAVEAEGLDIHNQRFGLKLCALKDAASLSLGYIVQKLFLCCLDHPCSLLSVGCSHSTNDRTQ